MKPEPAKRVTELLLDLVNLKLLSSVSRTDRFQILIPALKRRAIFTPSATADDVPTFLGKADLKSL